MTSGWSQTSRCAISLAKSVPKISELTARGTVQLLEWVKAPVTNAEIGNVTALQCSTPVVDAKICNGIEENEVGLLLNCPFIDFPW